MENNKLFSEFEPVSTEKWEEVINKDLKGADYQKKLVWRTLEGFSVKPYYRAEDLQGLEYLESNPAEAPYTRGKQAGSNIWDIRQDIKGDDLAAVNAAAREAVKRGATSLGLNVRNIESLDDVATLLDGINPEEVKLNFSTCCHISFMKLFVEYIRTKGYDAAKIQGSCNHDMFRYALKHGAFRHGEEGDLQRCKELVEYCKAQLPQFRCLTINANMAHNAGSNTVQELAFALSAANELIARLTDMGCKIEEVASSIMLSFATGSNYFMEIAKIRAARLLWSKMVEQYQPQCQCAYKVYITASSSKWNKSIFDPYVNMLRTTTETMSAAVAGADAICTEPFDSAYKEADDFSYRIARNQQLLLKEESYMDKIVDPAAGSYYIENLTNSIAQYAWEQFVKIEQLGGFCKALRQGYVQDEVERTAQQRDMDIATRKTTILGTNQYPNLGEKMSEKIQATGCCCCCKNEKGNEIRTLRLYRGAEAFEELRLATERSAKRPKVFLLTYGNLAMRKARSGFATNFFGVAGYEIIDNAGFANAEEGVEAALKANADVVVMCSSDDEYAEIAEKVCQGLKGKVRSIVIAGFPKEMIETYKSYGVDEFIHVKTNALECLAKYNGMLL